MAWIGYGHMLRREDFTEEQWKVIVASPSVDMAVEAGPGAGKSRTAAARVARLIMDENVPPEGIVATTFTDVAGTVLYNRILQIVGTNEIPGNCISSRMDMSSLTVATLHAYLRGLLQSRVPRSGKMRLLSNAERDLLLRRPKFARAVDITRIQRLDVDTQVINAIGERVPMRTKRHRERTKSRSPYLTNHPDDRRLFFQAADIAREECLRPDVLPPGFNAALVEYRNLLAKQNMWDYAELLCAAYAALTDDREPENQKLQKHLHETLRCVLVDEFQDVNIIIIRILKRLHTLGARITAVGDGDQVCYRWRGSDPRIFSSFARAYPDAEQHLLSINFRSTPEIVTSSLNFIERKNIAGRALKPLRTPDTPYQKWEPGDLSALKFHSTADQDAYGILWLRNLYGSPYRDKPATPTRGITWGDMRVVVRTSDSARRLSMAIEASGIPCHLVGADYLLGSAEEQAIASLYGYLGSRMRAQEVQLAWSEANLGISAEALGPALAYLDNVRETANEIEHPTCLIEVMYSALRKMGFSRDIIPELFTRRADQVLSNIGRVFRAAQAYQCIFFRALASWKFPDFAYWLYAEAPRVFDDDHTSPIPLTSHDAVQISTIHGAKGVEAVAIWVADLHEDHLPHYQARADVYSHLWEIIPRTAIPAPERYDGTVDDEAYLMYVSLTRAAKFTLLSYGRPDLRYDKLGRPRPVPGPSRYLLEMGRDPRFTTNQADAIPPVTRQPKIRAWRPEEDVKTVLTPSELTMYHSCPHQFRLRVIHGFPPSTSEYLGYAESLHRCHAEFEQVLQSNGNLSDNDILEILNKQFDVPFADQGSRSLLHAAAAESFTSYARWAKERAMSGVLTEAVEQNIRIEVGNIQGVGRLDMAQRDVDGRTIVIDWKASERASGRDPDMFKSQIYALGQEMRTGATVAEIGTCVAGNAGNPPTIRTEPFDVPRRTALFAKLKKAGAAIPVLDLPMTPLQGAVTCADCDTCSICSHSQNGGQKGTDTFGATDSVRPPEDKD